MVQKEILFGNTMQVFYKKNIRYIMLQKYAVEKKASLVLEKVDLKYSITTLVEDDINLMHSLVFLETITGQKSIGYGVYKYVGSTKKFFFNSVVTLKKNMLFIFFGFLGACCIPKFIKRNGLLKKKKVGHISVLKINDLNIFYNYNVYNLKGRLNIVIAGNKDMVGGLLQDILKICKIKL